MDTHHLIMTFVAAAAFGVFFQLMAQKIKVSGIVLLLLGGILVGPEFLGLVHPESLGGGLRAIVSLAVGIILFEGGLTLDIRGYRQVSREIWGVLTKGILVTLVVCTVSIKFIFDFSWTFSTFASSLIIVTGPTVVGPLLQRIRVKKRLHHILYWEGVLIDPIGVFVALLCYEWIELEGTPQAFVQFIERFAVGGALGLGFGGLIYWILKKEWIPDERLNIFVLTMAMLNFAVADILVTESGLLSVTIAGFLLGAKKTPKLDQIIEYKVELKDFLIGLLFVLLAANLSINKFLTYGTALIAVVAIVMFIARPLNIWLSTLGSNLKFKEKLFLSWIAPRGIVAASMASLFSYKLAEKGFEDAPFLETFTYSVIAGTVIFQGFSAKWVGDMLGVLEERPKGWLVVGAHRLGRLVGRFIEDQGGSVVLIDTNPREVKLAMRGKLTALCDNAIMIDPEQKASLYGLGNIVAITENQDLNVSVCKRWQKIAKYASVYRWGPTYREGESADGFYATGTPIWNRFHLREILAQNEDEAQIKTLVTTTDVKEVTNPDFVLMCRYKDNFYPQIPKDAEGEITVLMVAPTEDEGLGMMTQPNWILFSNENNLVNLYSKMLTVLSNDFPGIDTESLFEELVRREEEFTSLLGNGVSLPHTYTDAVDETILMVAKVDPELPCQHTGQGINLIFMLLSPENKPVEHLNKISKIAKMVMKEENREKILNTKSPIALYKLLNSIGS